MRKAKHAGSWYPNDPEQLNADLDKYMPSVHPQPQIKAIIAPHAGYAYSGATAGFAYQRIDPNLYDRVVLMGPSHKIYLDFVGMTECSEWETPLGCLRVDVESIEKLTGKLFKKIPVQIEQNEHSLELHLPFIKKIFSDKNVSLLPLMVGELAPSKLYEFSKAL
jgi:MEMO1 family protein